MTGTHVIIGGLGALGRHMQRALLSVGKPIRVLDLPLEDAQDRLICEQIDFFPCDISRDNICRALRGAETVYLMVTPPTDATRKEFEACNVFGIKRVLDACRDVGVSKIIYVSSIAVSDHSKNSRNVCEEDPLPSICSYTSWYDKTKRLGEELVLSSNGNKLSTCALRVGGIISGSNNYMFRQWFQGERLVTIESSRIDFMSAKDVCRALIKADYKLDDPSTEGLAGEALYLTKGADRTSVRTSDLSRHLAATLDWKKPLALPCRAIGHLSRAMRVKNGCDGLRANDSDDLPGVPSHMLMRVPCFEKTFDNRKALRVLDFKPQLTWKEAIEDVAVEEYFSLKEIS